MNIRARLNLEIGKFKANAKAAGASFKVIASSAKVSTNKIDSYLKSSTDKRLAQIKRTEAQEIESARRKAKILSKVEQEKFRNQGGIKAGTNVGRNLGLELKLSKESIALIEKRKAAELKASNAIRKSRLKEAAQAVKSANKTQAAEIRALAKVKKAREVATGRIIKGLYRTESIESKVRARITRHYEKSYAKGQKASLKFEAVQKQASKKSQDYSYFNSKKFEKQMAGARYALYDISRRSAVFGTAIAGAFGLAAAEAIKFQSAFTSVERTTQLSLNSNLPEVRGQAEELRKALVDMSLEIPVAFEDITKAATLGAQLGIAADAVDGFSETVIKFATITGISVDEVGLSFGRLAQLLDVPVSQFENLSSAITFTGINSVATDREILRMSESIGAAGYMAGLSADEVVGFSSALASLKIRPEEARGVFTRLFRTFDIEASLASERMDDFASMMGKTTEEAISLYRNDPTDFFKQFLYGANATGELNVAMKELGIVNTRELNVITRLAGNMGVLEQALSDSREQYLLGTYSGEAFAQVVDDISSRIQIMQNSIAALGAVVGEPLSEIVGFFADITASIAQFLTNMGPVGKGIILLFGGLLAGAALFFAALTGGIAGLLALKFAFKSLAADGMKASISIGTFTGLLRSMTPAAAGATAGVTGLSGGIKILGLSIKTLPFVGLIATLTTVAAVLIDAGIGASKATEDFSDLGKAGIEAGGGLSAAMEAIAKDAEIGNKAISKLTIKMSEEEAQTARNKAAYIEMAEAHDERTKSTKNVTTAFETAEAGADSYKDSLLGVANAENGIGGGTSVDKETTVALGEEYVKWLALGARKYAKEDGTTGDLLTEMLGFGVGTDVEANLRALGFDYMELYRAAVADSASSGGSGMGAQAYADAFDSEFTTSLDAIAFKAGATFSSRVAQAISAGQITEETGAAFQKIFDSSGLSMQDFFNQIRVIPGAFDEAALAADSVNSSVQSLATADGIERQRNSAAGLAEDVEDAEDAVKSLSDAIDGLFSARLADNKAADALDTFAQSAKETSGELDGMGEAARENLSNFAAFMQSAMDAAEAAGEGAPGALRRIVDGLYSLQQAGIDTGDAFAVAKDLIINNLIAVMPVLEGLREELGAETSLAGIEAAIRASYALKQAALPGGALGAAVGLFNQMNAALALLDGSASKYAISFGKVTSAAEKTLTTLEKLQQQISKVFRVKNIYVELYDSLNTLGKSLSDNGKTFSIYSEAGRSNISALQDTINMFAEKSGGNVNKFANDLASLRAALVQAGAPVSALKMIDDTVKKIGVTGKASAHNVGQFAKALVSTGDSVRELYAVKSAMDAITSGLRQAFSAIFSQADALDSVTLGWLDMSDAADAARESITNAGYDIRDARLEIEKLDAEINGLAADKGKLEYQLSIALKYGDTLRANELRAEIAQLDADVAAKEASISDANGSIAESTRQIADANGVLGSNSTVRQQIERNEALRDMALRYGDVAASLIASAKPGEDLNEIINDQVTAFEQSAIKMGYSNSEASDMADTLRDELIYQMDQIPEDITTDITAETSVATAAVDRFVNFANARMNQIKDKIVTVTTIYQSGGGSAVGVIRRASGGLVSGPGSSTSDSISAQLSNGEYVVRASAVSKYGVDFFNSLNQMQTAPAGMSSAISQQSGGNGMVYLSPDDRQLLRAAIDRPISLYTDNTVIASSANKGNQILAQRGIK